ncbi:MAG: AAA family ATPase, partial [Polyangiaceae bacterium]
MTTATTMDGEAGAPIGGHVAERALFPVRRAVDLEQRAASERWLVEGLWSAEAVGIVGGEPKCCKSFLALELAVSVASGAPCLRRFPCRERGTALL